MPTLIMFRLLLTSALLLALAGCASNPATPPASPLPEMGEQDTAAADATEPPERAFPQASFYPLLLAEFALRRNDYNTALNTYLQQAPLLRDPAISSHATHLAQFMKREAEAFEAADLWVELEPDSAEANNTLATLLIRKGHPARALPLLAVVARHDLQANFPMLLSGFRELPINEQSDLREAVNTLLLERPDDTGLLLTQALILDELEDTPGTRAALSRLLALEPAQTQGLLLDAKLRLEAEEPKPFQSIDKALAENPDNKVLRLQYARLLTRSDIDAAQRQFEILSARSPRDGDLLLSLALLNQDNGDPLAAKAYLRQVLALEQRVDEARYYLGRILEDEGRTGEAIEAYRKVEDPTSREFFNANGRVGRLLIEQGDASGSAAFFDQQRAAYPTLTEQFFALEYELLTRAGLHDTGLALLNQGLSSLPEATSLRYSRAMLREQDGDLAGMEADLRYILQRDPDNATALNALGYTLSNRTNRYVEAEQLISRALTLAPEEPAILDSMGWVLFRQGRAEEALHYLRRAWSGLEDPEVAAHLGEVLWALGRTEEAFAIWRSGLQLDAQHSTLLETLQRLQIPAVQLSTE
ncbi:MAG: tetratricopeptide repeat protein [Haliea sp.]|jgi:tetratricopeptide (TPR) repeat protein|nr:tetratricopeptide repeat protein [Haliea sp.]